MENTYWKNLALTAPKPTGLRVTSARGIYLYDENEKPYMDLISGVGVNNIGHSDTRVIQAIQEQAAKHLHVMVYGEYEQESPKALAENLCSLLPQKLNNCYFTNSGTEAIEAAMKLAKRLTGCYEIIALEKSYHGNTQGSMSISGNELKKNSFRPLIPGTRFIRQNHIEDLDQITVQAAAVFIETIQGDAGVRIPSQKWLKALRARCDETDTLLVMDEIQTGIGRTGKWFAFEHWGVVPDMLTLGKALGGGIPIGALVTSKENMRAFTSNPMLGHITTFGGHPLACAAGNVALEILKQETWIEEVQAKSDLLFHLLNAHPLIKAIRYQGLFFAIDLETPDQVSSFLSELKSRKALAFRFLSAPFSFRLAPPLCITEDEIKEAAQRILDSLDAIA